MSKAIQLGDMSSTVEKLLEEYGKNVSQATGELIKKVANQAKDEVKSAAPVRTGKYKSSWSVKVETGSVGQYTIATIHSRNRYQIAHLLEKGHAKRNGGRVSGRPHIGPAEEKAISLIEEGVRQIAKG